MLACPSSGKVSTATTTYTRGFGSFERCRRSTTVKLLVEAGECPGEVFSGDEVVVGTVGRENEAGHGACG